MAQLSPLVIVTLIISVGLQIFAVYMMPLTRGLTQLVPTLIFGSAILVSTALAVRVAYSGVPLSLIIPLMAALVPLGGISVAIMVYGEPASWQKIGALVAACALVGVANII